MFGMNKKLASLPAAPRMVIGLLLLLLSLWGVVKLTVYQWVEAGIEAFSGENDIEYDSTFFRMNGDFGMNDVHVVHLLPDGTQTPEYRIDRVVVHTPGFAWLLKNAWFSTTKNFPERFGLTLENPRNTTDGDQTPGNYSNLPYDAMGCGVQLLTPAHFAKMGFPALKRDISGTLERIDDGTSKLHVALTSTGVGSLAMDFDIGYGRPVKWRDSLQTLLQAPISKASLSMKDLGFIGARNRYCAKEAAVAESAFGEHHMQAMTARMQKEQWSFGAETLLRYRQFAEQGGELQILSTSAPKISIGQFANLGRQKMLQAFPSQIRHDDGPLTPFVIGAAAPVAVATGTEPSSGAAPASPATPAPVAAGSADGVLSYRQLEKMVGAHIEVSTTMGTVRRGTLLSYGLYLSHLKLDADQGGFNLAIPANTIVQIKQILSPAESGTSMAAPNAQTH